METTDKKTELKEKVSLASTKSTKETINILHIEDNDLDVRLVQEYLKDSTDYSCNFIKANRLEQIFEIKDREKIDLILLDLYLPDCAGIETIEKTCFCFHEIPIIVTTGLRDNEISKKAIKLGAQDYLVKGDDFDRLSQSICFAMERKKLEQGSIELLRDQLFKDEIKSLENTVAEVKSKNAISIDKIHPEVFSDLVKKFTHTVEYAPGIVRQNKDTIKQISTKNLQKIAEAIGYLGGETEDLFKIYVGAVRVKSQEASKVEQEIFIERAHLLVLELMGHLINYYKESLLNRRKHSRGREQI